MTLKMATPPLDACVIGFAGHRKLIPSLEATVHADLPAIIATLRETLLADLGENQKFVLANGLAAGADLLVAAQFEKHFPEIELWHCLPMPEEEFRQGLLDGLENTDEISCKRIADEFDRLTASARYLSVIEAENCRRAEAYLLLAHAMVARCEGLVVVWDGMPAAGPGGTGDVVRVGTDAGLPVLHLKGEGQVGMMPSCANDLSKRESGKIFARLLAEKFFARRTEEGHCLKLKGAITPSLSGHAGKLVSRDRDKPAAQKHLAYLESQATDASLPAYRDWSQIEESHVHANRAAADHDAIKLFDLKRLKVISNADVATIERLAEVEHKRWCAERLLDGWIPAGNGVRDDAKQVHDNLVPWPSLSENTKQKDRDQVAASLNVNFGKSAM